MGADSDERGWGCLISLHGRIEQELAKVLHRHHGLGLSEYRALRKLAEAPQGELRIQELAEAIGLNQSSVSRLVARLDEAGLTERVLCDNDRRGVYSVITERGRAQLAAAAPSYQQALSTALDEAAATDRFAEVVPALRGLPALTG